MPAPSASFCPLIFEKHSDPFSYKAGYVRNLILRLYAKVEKLTVTHADAVIGTGPGLVDQVLDMGTSTPVCHIFDIPSSLVEPNSGSVHRQTIEVVKPGAADYVCGVVCHLPGN